MRARPFTTLFALSLLVAVATPLRADPVSGALLSVVSSSLAASATAVSITTFLLTSAVGLGLSYLTSALKGKGSAPDTPIGGSSGKLTAGGVIPRKLGIGTYVPTPTLAYANTFGDAGKTPNAILVQVMSLSDLPAHGLREVWVNGARVTYDPGAHPGQFGTEIPEFTTGGIAHLWVRFYDGHQTEADVQLVALFGEDPDRPYSARRIGQGIAYVIVFALVDQELFAGFPQLKFVLDGVHLYDRRFDSAAGGSGDTRLDDPATWSFSDNVAIARENILRGFRWNGAWQWGGQTITDAQLPQASWFAAANECAAQIALAGGGSEYQFRAGGEISFDMLPADVLEALNKADNGKLAEIGGVYKTRSGAPGAAVFHFTDRDILTSEAQTFEPFATQAATVNHVTGRYMSPADGWNFKDAPALVDAELEARDGRRLSAAAEYGFVSSATQVQRLMRAERDTARAFRRHALPMPPDTFVLEPLDVVSWTSARNGYVTKTFDIVSAEDLPNLNTGLALKELDPFAFDWVPGTHERPVSDGTITLLRPSPQPIIAWFADPYTLTVGSRGRAAILLGWDPNVADVDGIRFEVRLKAAQEVVLAGEEGQEVFARGAQIVSQNLLPETEYEARGQYRPASPRRVAWSNWLPVKTPDVRIVQEELSAQLDASIRQVDERFHNELEIVRADVEQLSAALNGQATGIIERAGRILIAAGSRFLENKASVQQALITMADGDSALAALVTVLEAAVANNAAAIDEESIARAGGDGALSARILSFLATSAFGTAENRIRFIASSSPSGAVASVAIEVNVSTTAVPNWQPAGIYLDAMAGFSRNRQRADLHVWEAPGLNGGAPFPLVSISAGEAYFSVLLRAQRIAAGVVDAATVGANQIIASSANIATATIQTLHAVGEAWTAIRVATGGDQATVNAELANIVKSCEGGGIVLLGTFHVDTNARPEQLFVQLSIDGSHVASRPIIISMADSNPGAGGAAAASSQGTHIALIATSVSTGTHTFRLHVASTGVFFGGSLQSSGTVVCRSPTLILLEAKR